MLQVKIIILALLRVGFAAAIFYVIGSWLGKPYELVSLALAAFLAWHIFSGRWLTQQLLKNKIKTEDSLSFLPLTYEDIRIFDVLREHHLELERLDMIKASSAALPDGVIVIDEQNRVRQANLKAYQFLGVHEQDDIGQRIDNLIRYPKFIRFLNDTALPTTSELNTTIEFNSPFDETIRLRLSCTHFSESLRMIVVQDVSNAYRLNKVRQDFIANASHELRTPLTVVRGYLEEMVEDKEMPKLWHHPLREIEKQSLRMQNIINDLSTLSVLESRSRIADMQPLSLSCLIGQVVVDLSQAFQKTHVIKADIPGNLLICGEESELYSIFSNLAKNACLYSDVGTTVDIRYHLAKDYHQLIVIDQGPGIPAESITRLTERFYRVDDGRSREKGGTGLGLAIVKHALMRHEAFLTIESEIDIGSQFICNFPMTRIMMTEQFPVDFDMIKLFDKGPRGLYG